MNTDSRLRVLPRSHPASPAFPRITEHPTAAIATLCKAFVESSSLNAGGREGETDQRLTASTQSHIRNTAEDVIS